MIRSCIPILLTAAIIPLVGMSAARADLISFQVDPTTFGNMDGDITGTEFTTTGSGGTGFVFEPTNNLVGSNRLFLSLANGLHFGGGGGSTLSFDFTPNQDIMLNSYDLSGSGFFLGNPFFDIREGATVLSAGNTANNSGDTHAFVGGPINLTGGNTYSFEATTFGAGTQAFISSWDYTVSAVPEPSSFALLATFAGLGSVLVRRRRPQQTV